MAVLEATTENFDELIGTDYAVVDFYGDHCGPCRFLEPIYNDASNDLAMIRFIRTSTDRNRELGERFGIRAVPTLLFFRNGEVVHQCKGAMQREALYQHISRLLYD